MTSRSAAGKGNGRSSTALTTLKIAVFAPMPSASVSTATMVKPGFFSNWRKANFKSFITQCLHRIDFGRLPSREIACDHGRRDDERCGYRSGHWVYGWQPVELRGNETLGGENSRNPEGQTGCEHDECLL